MPRDLCVPSLILAAEIPAVMLVVIWLCPALTLMVMVQSELPDPWSVGEILFFWPQYVFPLRMTLLENGLELPRFRGQLRT